MLRDGKDGTGRGGGRAGRGKEGRGRRKGKASRRRELPLSPGVKRPRDRAVHLLREAPRGRRRALADVVHARVARVGAGAVVEGRADGEAPAVRAQRDRSARLVLRRLAVDVAAELGPGRSIILEDPRVALAVMPLLPRAIDDVGAALGASV